MISKNEDLTCVCTSKVTDMSNLFYIYPPPNSNVFFTDNSFNQDISSWDTSNVRVWQICLKVVLTSIKT